MQTVSNEITQREEMPCPVCGGLESAALRPAFDDRYGHPGAFSIAACLLCGHWMTEPRLREDQLGELYGRYYPRKHIDVAGLRREAAKVLQPLARLKRWWNGTDNQGQYAVHRGETLLDVGSGSGLSLLEATALGARAFGVEADPNTRLIAEELGLRIHIGSLHDEPFPDQHFDLIVLNQVIEHIPDPAAALALIRSRLAPGGRVVMVMPNRRSFWCRWSGERWINWHIPYHLHHFDLGTFSQMARRCGYRVITSRTVTPNLWSLLQLRAMRVDLLPGRPSPLWVVVPVGAAGEAAALGWRRRARLLAMACISSAFAILNRFLDLLGRGDSLVVELQPVDAA